MKILIVDDCPDKTVALRRELALISSEFRIISVGNARDGFVTLCEDKFDLVLLDVVLPLGFDDAPDSTGSKWFLREVERKISAVERPLIVGTTQYKDSFSDALSNFQVFLWSVIFVDENDVNWKRQLMYAAQFVIGKSGKFSLTTEAESADVAILTALRDPEFTEVVAALGGGSSIRLKETNELWLSTSLVCEGGRTINVIAACADEMGLSAMASLTTKVTIVCKPKVIILCGIMAGNRDRVSLSDLVIIESTWNYREGKLTKEGFKPDVRSRECTFRLSNRIQNVLNEDFVLNFWKSFSGERPKEIASVHSGAVACSPAVVSGEDPFPEIEEQRRKVLGLEMEAYGFYDAARRLGDLAPEIVCIKSVCDFGDGSKNDKYQRYCAALAASAVVNVLCGDRFGD